MKHLSAATVVLVVSWAAVPGWSATAAPDVLTVESMSSRCTALARQADPTVKILTSAPVPAGPLSHSSGGAGSDTGGTVFPGHCLITGVIDQRQGVGGKEYGIRFEMRLPSDWNGRFLFQGGGGLNGVVRPAIGAVKGPAALALGYSVISQDAGHEGSDASFGEDQQARIDMEYRSYERVTAVGKSLVSAYYGQPAHHSYFMGCSEGGREALLVSQRLPLEYDGVVAGDPGFLLGVSLKTWIDRNELARISPRDPQGKPDLRASFSDRDLEFIAARILRKCDAQDGLADGLIDNYPACHIDVAQLTCKGGETQQCLSPAQTHVLDIMLNGKRDGRGKVLSVGYPYDTGIGESGWRYKIGPLPIGSGGVGPMQGLFLTPYEPHRDDLDFDPARDAVRMVETGSLYRADGVMYSSYRQHGGKMLIYTGLSDPTFSPLELIEYYQRLSAANGGLDATRDFARLFLVPGMTHCTGGRSLDEFDPLEALSQWVENGRAPERLIARGTAFPGRTRPLCAYPQQTRYRGTGSIEAAENFECRLPSEGVQHASEAESRGRQ
jgi:feruloyl esterase